MEKLRTKATFIKDRYYIRLLEEDLVINEMACKNKEDISWCCNYMLRWFDKLGGESKMASASRSRWYKNKFKASGKIWYEKDPRSKVCYACGKKSFKKGEKNIAPGTKPMFTDEMVIKVVVESQSFLEVSKKLKTSRYWITKRIKQLELDISHFIKAINRPYLPEEIF